MKRVTMTYTMEFPDDVTDDKCFEITIETESQDRHWPNDDQIKIEHIPEPTRPTAK